MENMHINLSIAVPSEVLKRYNCRLKLTANWFNLLLGKKKKGS